MTGIIVALLLCVPACHGAGFEFGRDTFAFPNETYWEYGPGEAGTAPVRGTVETATYTRRCFVLCRGALQFRKFVRFEPGGPPLPEAQLRARLREIFAVPAWRGPMPLERRFVIPGYRDLRSFSAAHPEVLKATLGNWWPTYLRSGNWRMGMPFPRSGQAATAALLRNELDRGKLCVAYLTRFRPMNHAVLVYGYRCGREGIRFLVYDPNEPGKPRELRFDGKSSSFEFPRTPYWGGGRVNVFLTYRWLLS